jgi:hypothetical protein
MPITCVEMQQVSAPSAWRIGEAVRMNFATCANVNAEQIGVLRILRLARNDAGHSHAACYENSDSGE